MLGGAVQRQHLRHRVRHAGSARLDGLGGSQQPAQLIGLAHAFGGRMTFNQVVWENGRCSPLRVCR